jgi:hypothetical protein
MNEHINTVIKKLKKILNLKNKCVQKGKNGKRCCKVKL